MGRQADAKDYVNQVRALDPARADRLRTMFATIDQKVSTPLTDALPALPEPGLGIVTLGYGLHGDGSMDDILIDRLQQTKAAAQRWPTAPVVVNRWRRAIRTTAAALAGHPFSGHPQTGGSTDE